MCTWGFSGDLVGKKFSCNAGDAGSIPGSRRYPGGGHGNSLQYSCLENSVDRRAWLAKAHRLTKSWAHSNDYHIYIYQISHSVVSDSLRPHELQHARPPCPSPTPRVHSDSRPSSQCCHPAISSSVVPFSSCPQSFPASESFPMSQLFA